jgi:hypothetical protein
MGMSDYFRSVAWLAAAVAAGLVFAAVVVWAARVLSEAP